MVMTMFYLKMSVVPRPHACVLNNTPTCGKLYLNLCKLCRTEHNITYLHQCINVTLQCCVFRVL